MARPRIEYVAPPTLERLHLSDAFVRGIMGPIGSGKSTGCAWEIFRRAQEQQVGKDGKRRTRWAIVRNTYRELADTTVKTWLDWFPERYLGPFTQIDMIHRISFGDVECEVLFRALDRPQDVKKLLSLELTGAWVNEAREIPKSVIDMLQGRVGRFPSKRDGGPSWFGVLMDTNPPDNDHWWYTVFEEQKPKEFELFKQPSGLSPEAENVDNLPPRYYERMMAGKDEEWIKVYVHGEYGFISDGRPIYPEYVDSLHCGDVASVPGEVYIGIDFGLTPAATFGQRLANGRWVVLEEIVSENMGALRFSQELKHRMSRYKGHKFVITGDPAGEQRAQTDEQTPFDILNGEGIAAFPADTNDFTLRREAVAEALSRLIDGKAGLIMDPACRTLRKGMSGGYSYKRVQVSGDARFHDKPDKNRYSHVCEALQYMLLGGGESIIKTPRFGLLAPQVSIA